MSRRHYDNKLMIWDLLQAINADPAAVADLLRANSSQSVIFDGPHPINHLAGADGIVHGFWRPLLAAFPDLIRRPYILMGGESFDGSEWVSSTGDFIATFAKDWLLEGVTIPASRTTVRIRYGEFCKIEAGQISQIVLLLDLPDLLWQAGHNIFPPSLGSEIWIPGPLAGDGILLEPQDEGVSRESVRIVEAMLDGLRRYDGKSKESMGMVRFWRLDMLWYGPRGIGTRMGCPDLRIITRCPSSVRFRTGKVGITSPVLATAVMLAPPAGLPFTLPTRGPTLTWREQAKRFRCA